MKKISIATAKGCFGKRNKAVFNLDVAGRKDPSKDIDPHGTVVLNWHGTQEKELKFFAKSFHLTAKESVAVLRQDPHFGTYGNPIKHFRAYPIVFLYRHALELYMKAVILDGAPMLLVQGKDEIDKKRLLKTHNLDILRHDLERVFNAFGWDWDLGVPHFKVLQDFRNVIKELHNVDAGSFVFRYPITTEGEASLKSPLQFNLFEFCKILDELFPVLDVATTAAYEKLQITYMSMAEARQLGYENPDCESE
jgi:hypothetical protein